MTQDPHGPLNRPTRIGLTLTEGLAIAGLAISTVLLRLLGLLPPDVMSPTAPMGPLLLEALSSGIVLVGQ